MNPLNRTFSIFGINGGPGVYGYGWWTNGRNPEGNRVLPGVPPATFFAYGIDNNFIFVIPEWNMVVVREATNEGDSSVSNNIWATFLSLVGDAVADAPGGESARIPYEFTRLPYAIYRTRDMDLDGSGDQVERLLGQRVDRPFKAGVGETDLATGVSLSRLVAKFALPDATNLGTGVRLEQATLRFFYLESLNGMPTESVSVFHSVVDNDTDHLASDYEDATYTDTLLELVQPTDEAENYFEVDVTAFVQSDYQADGVDPLSAFRLQVTSTSVFADGQSMLYEFAISGNQAHYPELVLTFVPEPSAIAMMFVGFIASGVRWRPSRISCRQLSVRAAVDPTDACKRLD